MVFDSDRQMIPIENMVDRRAPTQNIILYPRSTVGPSFIHVNEMGKILDSIIRAYTSQTFAPHTRKPFPR